ncbi:MAG: hypothetical protein HOV94_07855 [Saccharothrix sp.]|nr:hypothetical protein [Saccharothrix sp.]
MQNATLNRLVDLRAPEPVRDRVTATVGAVTACSGTVAVLVAGAVAATAGARASLTAASAVVLLGALMATWSILRRDHRRPVVVSS